MESPAANVRVKDDDGALMAIDDADLEQGHQAPPRDVLAPKGLNLASMGHDIASPAQSMLSETKFRLWEKRVERLIGVEARGIHRVEKHEKTAEKTLSALNIVLMWVSINTAAQNITLAMIGSSAYGLGFLDAAFCSIFGAIVGSLPAAYMATWGPVSGNRTLVRTTIPHRSQR